MYIPSMLSCLISLVIDFFRYADIQLFDLHVVFTRSVSHTELDIILSFLS